MSEFSDGLNVGSNLQRYDGDGWGNNGWWIILLFILFLGGNGFNRNQNQGYEMGKLATTNDVASGFSTSTIMSNQRELQLGQTQGFADVQQTLCQGFSGINSTINTVGNTINQGICTLGYNIQGNFNQLSHQLSDCCCQTQRAIDGVNYNIERGNNAVQNAICNSTRDIIDNQRCGTDRIINFLTNQEMDRLRNENQTLRFQASQNAQNAYLVDALRPTARPAYITCSPYDSAFGNRYGWNYGGCCDSCCG